MAVAVGVAVAVGCCSPVVVAGCVPSTVVVGLLLVCSVVRAGGGSGSPAGVPVRSSTIAESNVERVMATTIAPKSITGASAAVRGNSAHGESPAWVRSRTR